MCFSYLGLQKNLYCMRRVRPNITVPWMDMANRFLPTKFQLRGFSKRSSPENRELTYCTTNIIFQHWTTSFCMHQCLTQVFVEVGHCLVFGHVHQASSQTEMRKHQQSLFHYVIDASYILDIKTDETENGNVRLETHDSSKWVNLHAHCFTDCAIWCFFFIYFNWQWLLTMHFAVLF